MYLHALGEKEISAKILDFILKDIGIIWITLRRYTKYAFRAAYIFFDEEVSPAGLGHQCIVPVGLALRSG